MSSIEKIKAGIERLKKILEESTYYLDNSQQALGYSFALDDFKEFIDSLSEEKATCKTCGFYENNCPFIRGKLIPYPNKVCKDYTYSVMKEQKPSEDLEEAAKEYATTHLRNNEFPTADSAFIAGAKWMRKKDVEDMYMSDNRHFLKCYEQGKVDMKVEMMNGAVEGEIVKDITNKLAVTAKNVNLDGFKFGDKVKIIIVKQ